MASSLSTKLRIAYNVLFAPGFFDAVAGRLVVAPGCRPALGCPPTLGCPPPPAGTLWVRGDNALKQAAGNGLPSPAFTPPLAGAGGQLKVGGQPNAGRQPEKWRDVRGALHNHSTYSDGLSDIPTIMDAAKNAGVDFVLLADHNTMEPLRDGWQERYAESDVFLLAGTEVTVGDGRFLLALDVPPEYEPVAGVPAQDGINRIREHGGFPLISLPFDMKHPFEDWSVSGYEGLEVLNFSTIARRHINFLSLPLLLLAEHRGGMMDALRAMATRPDAALARWDGLTRGGARQIVGIGSLDAHAQMKMFGKKYPFPTYADSFRAVQTHVLINETVTGAARLPAVNAALRAGRCYFGYDCLRDPTGFAFTATNIAHDTVAEMGERLTADAGDTVRFTATAPGENVLVRLYKNGVAVTSSAHGTLDISLRAEPGAYRVEAFLYRGRVGALFYGVRPWLYGNPVYVGEK